MFIAPTHKDRVGALICQLKGLELDMAHHRKVGKSIEDVHADYPKLRSLVLECLIENNKLHPVNTTRVEAAGYDVMKIKGSDRIIINSANGQVSFTLDNPETDNLLKTLETRVKIPASPAWNKPLLSV